MTLKIAISGITGRLGQAVLSVASLNPTIQVCQGLMPKGHATVGTKIGNIPIYDTLLDDVTVLIDFSVAEATALYAKECASKKIALVTGTTGLSAAEQAEVTRAAQSIPLVQAPNTSIGVNVLYALVEQTEKMLGATWDVHILEAHRKDKRDAPSGTALAIGKTIQSVNPDVHVEYASIRAGDILGEHKISFVSPQERIVVEHHAFSRDQFASGALTAALWVVKQKPGLYSMRDVLEKA